MRWNQGSSCAVADSLIQICLHTNLIPKPLFYESIQSLRTAFHDERLDVMGIQAAEAQGVGMIDDQALRIRAIPVANIQLWMFALISDAPHEDGILFCAELMGKHLGEVAGNLGGLEMVVEESVGRLCPFQDDVRALFAVIGEEAAVQCLTFRFQHSYFHLDTCIA